ncbi:MAG: hypothetical protein JNM22_21640 [Saprospiraceae bacterium]|nr:hypothetical protein [Saprospiraceae bacterium]
MLKLISFLLLVTLLPENLMAQDFATHSTALFENKAFFNARQKETRSNNGFPGKKYWQNRVAYKINAILNPNNHTILGSETVTYHNESPHSLNMIRFNLRHEAYRKDAMRKEMVDMIDIRDSVTLIKKVELIGDQKIDKITRSETFMDVYLDPKTPLEPKSKLVLNITWELLLPIGSNAPRTTVFDSTVFFVGYWYPQVAVYDDIHRWDSVPHDEKLEFYNEFSNYDVTIRVPNNMMVWATGNWDNPQDVLIKKYLQRYSDAKNSDTVVSIWKKEEMMNGVFKPAMENVFHFHLDSVSDFAFATSTRYNWDGCRAIASLTPNQYSFVSAVYDTNTRNGEGWDTFCKTAADGIEHMVKELPKYPFPFPSMVIFEGDDNMEFPGMVNQSLEHTQVLWHEILHSYFPFLTGINESDNAFLDEGLASCFDLLLVSSLKPEYTLRNHLDVYGSNSGTITDVPPMVLSRNLEHHAYSIASYFRPATAYIVLRDMLGDELFRKCLTAFIDTWKYKHPSPYDFFYTFNRVSEKDLNWFWKKYFFEFGSLDLSVVNYNTQNISIANTGGMPYPIFLELHYADGTIDTVYKPASVWKDSNIYTAQSDPRKKLQSVKLKSLSGSDLKDSRDIGNIRFIPLNNPHTSSTRFVLKDSVYASDYLCTEDDFTKQLTPFDLSARKKTSKPVSKQDYFRFLKTTTRNFSTEEEKLLSNIFNDIKDQLDKIPYKIQLPKEIILLKTSGEEEGDAAYTRRNAIIFPQSDLNRSTQDLRSLCCHELWHIISRYNPDLKKELYQETGFSECSAKFPDSLKTLRVTNPDAPNYDYCCKVLVKGIEVNVAPIIYASSMDDDSTKKKEFFKYIVGFPSPQLLDIYSGRILSVNDVKNYDFETFGTDYIIHPEEIVADHFSYILQNNFTHPLTQKLAKKIF